MALWRVIPVAHAGDGRWQDHPIWQEVVVRAPSATMARMIAAQMEARRVIEAADGQAGNESPSDSSALHDEKLYRVEDLSHHPEAGEYGPEGVISATLLKPGPYLEPEKS